jgi:hypothetical protein
MNPTQHQIIAYKLRVLGQLADSMALFSADQDGKKRGPKIRKALALISDTVTEIANEVLILEPLAGDPEHGFELEEMLAILEGRVAYPLSRS